MILEIRCREICSILLSFGESFEAISDRLELGSRLPSFGIAWNQKLA